MQHIIVRYNIRRGVAIRRPGIIVIVIVVVVVTATHAIQQFSRLPLRLRMIRSRPTSQDVIVQSQRRGEFVAMDVQERLRIGRSTSDTAR